MMLWLILGCAGGWLLHAGIVRVRARAVERRVSELHAHAEHASTLAEVEAILADSERPLEDRIGDAFSALRRSAPVDRAVAVCGQLVFASGVTRLELESARGELAAGSDASEVARNLVSASAERTVIPLVSDGAHVGVLAMGGGERLMYSQAVEATCAAVARFLGRAVARAGRSTVPWSPADFSVSV